MGKESRGKSQAQREARQARPSSEKRQKKNSKENVGNKKDAAKKDTLRKRFINYFKQTMVKLSSGEAFEVLANNPKKRDSKQWKGFVPYARGNINKLLGRLPSKEKVKGGVGKAKTWASEKMNGKIPTKEQIRNGSEAAKTWASEKWEQKKAKDKKKKEIRDAQTQARRKEDARLNRNKQEVQARKKTEKAQEKKDRNFKLEHNKEYTDTCRRLAQEAREKSSAPLTAAQENQIYTQALEETRTAVFFKQRAMDEEARHSPEYKQRVSSDLEQIRAQKRREANPTEVKQIREKAQGELAGTLEAQRNSLMQSDVYKEQFGRLYKEKIQDPADLTPERLMSMQEQAIGETRAVIERQKHEVLNDDRYAAELRHLIIADGGNAHNLSRLQEQAYRTVHNELFPPKKETAAVAAQPNQEASVDTGITSEQQKIISLAEKRLEREQEAKTPTTESAKNPEGPIDSEQIAAIVDKINKKEPLTEQEKTSFLRMLFEGAMIALDGSFKGGTGTGS